MAERRIAQLKTISLEGIIANWEGTKFVSSILDYDEFSKLAGAEELDSDTAKLDVLYGILERSFVSGKIMVLGENNELVLDDMLKTDIRNLGKPFVDQILAELTGARIDPKDTRPAVPATVPQPNADTTSNAS